MSPGRPSILTEELIVSVCVGILDGNYRMVAAKRAGLNQNTLEKWSQFGKDDPTSIYGRFLRMIEESEAAAEAVCAKRVMDAGQGDWKAAMEWLARKFPERWASNRSELVKLKKKLAELEAVLARLREESDAAHRNGHRNGDLSTSRN